MLGLVTLHACHGPICNIIYMLLCNAQAHEENGRIVKELLPQRHLDVVFNPATEGAEASASEGLAGKVWQQLEGRLAAWVQEAFAACAAVSTKLASQHDEVTFDTKESEAAGQDGFCPHINRTLPAEALEARLTASAVNLQTLWAGDEELLKGPMSIGVRQ